MKENTMLKKRLSNQTFIDVSMLAILAVFYVVACILVPTMFSAKSLMNIISQQSYIIIMGIGVTFLLITGNFDLSVGAVAAYAGVFMTWFCQAYDPNSSSALTTGLGMNYWVALGITMALCVFIGLMNALFIVRFKVASVIVTLGNMYIARGIAWVVTEGATRLHGLPDSYGMLGRFQLFNIIGLPVILVVVIAAISLFIEKRTCFGRKMYLIGSNKKAAEISGIDINRYLIVLYIASAVLAGIAGVLLSSKFEAGRANMADGYEFDALVATVLGGSSIAGGFGSITSLIIGTLILGILSSVLNQLGAASDIQVITKGFIIVIAVLAQRIAISNRKS